MSSELKTLMTVDDVAAYVNVPVNTVRSWIKTGAIPFLKAGQLVRFDPDEIQEWLRSREGAKARHPRNFGGGAA